MRKNAIISVLIIAIFATLGWYLLLKPETASKKPFSFGLDLVGGTELIYKADTSKALDRVEAMDSLRDVIERRVNIFGVSEPLVQTEHAGFISGSHLDRLLVELPGVTNLEEAKRLIGQTPILEFRLAKADFAERLKANPNATMDELFTATGLNGQYLSRSQVVFNQTTNVPQIGLNFNSEGAKLFAEITRNHKGEQLAIILDGNVLSAPVIQEEISNGEAQITGSFTLDQAKELVRNLNYGALPVPIELLSSQTIGATLGEQALKDGLFAGILGFILLSLFLVIWYRLPGLVSVIALSIYVIISLVLFKLVPVTLTAAGIAGFILSVGMAVDANVLIFERAKEELKRGKNIHDAFHEGFKRAWNSIRDSNISSLITALVLFWLGTSAVKGFALTLGLGVLVSMFTAITVSRTFLFAIARPPAGGLNGGESKFKRFLFSNGLHLK